VALGKALSVFFVASLLVSTAYAADTPAKPRITRVLVKKDAHTMTLFAGETSIKTYTVAIGPGGSGPKRKEGDMVTPVGRYHITMHQPSQYKIFLRLDYPTADDWSRFNKLKASGALPKEARIGGDIGIHGPPVRLPADVRSKLKSVDWTAGCIALDEDEIEEVSKLVPDGTIVDIED
jgi:murein L,D-transpeptidase YafK